MQVVVYLGAIDPAGSAGLVEQARARAEADGHEVAGVFWDPSTAIDVPLEDRPGYDAALGSALDREAGGLLFDPVTAAGDAEVQEAMEPIEPPRCATCGGTDVIIAVYKDLSTEEVCVTCRPDHPVAVWQRKQDR